MHPQVDHDDTSRVNDGGLNGARVLEHPKPTQILETLPASGWYALFSDPDDSDRVVKAPLVCWATVEDCCPEHGDFQHVVGLVAQGFVASAEQAYNFLRYIHELELCDQEDVFGDRLP